MKRYAVPVIAVVSLLFAVMWTWAKRPVPKASTPPVTPPEAVFPDNVAAVGLVEPETENIQLSCSVSGMVTAVYVKAGDRVTAGQKLFSVDDRDVQADLRVKQAALDNARAQLAKLKAEPRPEELPPLEAKVAEAKSQLEDARVQAKLIESVSDRRAVKQEDVLRRRLAVETAQARLAQALNDLALARAGAWAPDLAIAHTQVEQAEGAVRQDEVSIDRLTTRAPVTGIVLQNNVRPGQYAQCGQVAEPLMILGGGSSIHLRAEIDENEAWRVKAGNNAVARVRGNAKISFPLEFVRFEPYVIPKKSLTGDSTERVDTRVLEAIYRFRDPNPAVYDGQQMDVFIHVSSARHSMSRQEGGQ